MKTVWCDMDGTLADFYGVNDWLSYLQNESTFPYEAAKPLIDVMRFLAVTRQLKAEGWKIGVISWGSKYATREYNKRIRKAKINWLKQYGFEIDEIHVVKYGTPKQRVTKDRDFQILVDDEENNLNAWDLGAVIDAKTDIIEALEKLL